MMVRWLIAALFVLLVALSACSQQTINAQPLNNTLPQPLNNAVPQLLDDACATIQCGENAYCEAGVCKCSGGFKKCNDKCIADSSCCTNTECGAGKICDKGSCAERPVCSFNEAWNNDGNKCICAEGTKFCHEQEKCIPVRSCCAHIECKRDQRCTTTTYSAFVCIKSITAKCRMVHDGISTSFATPVGDFVVSLENVFEGPLFDIKVGNDTVRRLRPEEQSLIENGTAYVYVDSMTTFGGYCREEPD